MTIESATVEEFYQELLEGYLTKLHENDINSVTEYLEKVGVEESAYDSLHLDQQFDLRVFFRCFPEVGQQVMLAGINPGLKCTNRETTKFYPKYWKPIPEGDNWYPRFQATDGNVSQIAREGANNLEIYLSKQNLIDSLREHISLLSNNGSREDYLQTSRAEAYRTNPDEEAGVNVQQGFFRDIYYSQYCKLATPDRDGLSEIGVRNFADEQFRREVFDVVQPDLLIVAGKFPWQAIYEKTDEENIKPYCDSHLTDSYNGHAKGGAPVGLYEFVEDNMVVLTVRHFSITRYQNDGRFRRLLKRADELVS